MFEVVFHAGPEIRSHEDDERWRRVEPGEHARVDHAADLAVAHREDAQALLPDLGGAPSVVRPRALVGREVEPLAGDIAVRLDEAARAADVVSVELAGVNEVPADEAVPDADCEDATAASATGATLRSRGTATS